MEVIDVEKELLDEVEILGHLELFTELHVDKSTVPEGMYCYDLRHGEDNEFPAVLEESVIVTTLALLFYWKNWNWKEEYFR